MTYEIHIARHPASYLRPLERGAQDRILQRLDEIAADPYGPGTKLLTNAAGRRATRVGDWRIVFLVDDASRTIDVRVIAPRGRAYRDL